MKVSFEWTDELRDKAVELYENLNPTPETSTEAVKTVTDALQNASSSGEGPTVNAVRMILMGRGVYIKKEATSSNSGSSGGKRVNKQEALSELKSAISDVGAEVDDSIVDKMTGKAALYFVEIIRRATDEED